VSLNAEVFPQSRSLHLGTVNTIRALLMRRIKYWCSLVLFSLWKVAHQCFNCV